MIAEQRHARELQRQPFDQLRQEIRGCPCAGHLVDRANRGVEQRHHALDFPAQRLALLGVARGLAGPGGCLAQLRLGLLAQPCLRLQRVVQAQLQLPHRVFTLGALGFQRVRPRAAHFQLGDDDVVAFDGGDGCREIAFEGAGAAADGVEIGFDGAASAVGGGELRFERGDARVGGFELGFEQPRVLADDPNLAGERIALDGRLTGGRQLLLQRRTFAAGSFELGGKDVALVGDRVGRLEVPPELGPFGVMAIDVVPQVIDVGNRLFEGRSRRRKVVFDLGLRLHEMPGFAVGCLECRLELAMRIDRREKVTLGCLGPLLCRLELAPEQRCLGVGPGNRGRESGVLVDLLLELRFGFVDGAARFLADAPAFVAGPARLFVSGGSQARDELVDLLIGFGCRFDRPRRRVNRLTDRLKLLEGGARLAGAQAAEESGSFLRGVVLEFHGPASGTVQRGRRTRFVKTFGNTGIVIDRFLQFW